MGRKHKYGEKTERTVNKRKAKETTAKRRKRSIPYAKTKIKRPTYTEMIIRSFSDVGKHTTISKQAILAYICANFEHRSKTIANYHLKAALKQCVSDGYLKQVKGKGNYVSFLLLQNQTKRSSAKGHKTLRSNSSAKIKMSLTPSTVSFTAQVIKPNKKRRPNSSSTPRVHVTTDQSASKQGRSINAQEPDIPETRQSQPTVSPTPLSGIKAVKKYSFNLDPYIKGRKTAPRHIAGVAVTEDGRILFSEILYKTVAMFSTCPTMKFLSLVKVSRTPRGITVINDTEAVLCVDHGLVILDIASSKLKIKDTVALPYLVKGIARHRDKLIVTSDDYFGLTAVKLIDKSGKDYWSVTHDEQDQLLFQIPNNICSHVNNVIVSDLHIKMNTLTMLSGDTGHVISRRLVTKQPEGVATDMKGNVFVCYTENQEVSVFSSDLSRERTLISAKDGLSVYPRAITYDATTRQLFLCEAYDGICECFELL